MRLVLPSEALARERVRLAWRGSDQPPHLTKLSWVGRGDVGLKPLMAGGDRGRAGVLVVLDPERVVAELGESFLPAAGAGEQIDDGS